MADNPYSFTSFFKKIGQGFTTPTLTKKKENKGASISSPVLPSNTSLSAATGSSTSPYLSAPLVQPTIPKTKTSSTGRPAIPAITAAPSSVVGYSDLINKGGTIYNTKTNQSYGAGLSPAEAQAKLATDLGMRPDQIDWTKIAAENQPSVLASKTGDGSESSTAKATESDAQKALKLSQAAYEKSLQISPEELSTQQDIDNLLESAKKGYLATKGQPIAMEFITGQLKAIEDRATALTEPLERKLARLQAARQSSLESSKFALERADKVLESETSAAQKAREEAEKTRQFDVTTGLKERELTQSEKKADLEYRLSQEKFEEDKRQFGITAAQRNREIALKEKESSDTTAISPYQKERSSRTVQSVDELLTKAQATPGIFGRTAAAPIPGFLRSDAYRNFESELNTLKSNIAFNELTAMREASKTGGALGQVSDREGKLLESALGALDMGQSPENFQSQLQKIKDSINRWTQAANSTTAGSSYSGTTSSGLQWSVTQ